MHATDIVGYTGNAEILCPECMRLALTERMRVAKVGGVWPIESMLTGLAAAEGVDRFDERSFDSGDFPKVVFASQVEGPEPCGNCGADLIDP